METITTVLTTEYVKALTDEALVELGVGTYSQLEIAALFASVLGLTQEQFDAENAQALANMHLISDEAQARKIGPFAEKES